MKRRRRLEITVETNLLVVLRGASRIPVWCGECSSMVQTISPEEAAVLANLSTRALYRRVEAGRLHLIEPAEQSPLICLDSLLR